MVKWVRPLVIGLVVVLVTSLVAGRCYSSARAEWEARVERVQGAAEVHLERARAAEAEAQRWRTQAARLAEAAESAQPAIDSAVAELPPAETPGEEARDEVIMALRGQVTLWRDAFRAQQEAYASLRIAYDNAIARGDSLDAVLDARPGERLWFLPELTMGAFAGLCSTGQPCVGVGVGLGWRIGP